MGRQLLWRLQLEKTTPLISLLFHLLAFHVDQHVPHLAAAHPVNVPLGQPSSDDMCQLGTPLPLDMTLHQECQLLQSTTRVARARPVSWQICATAPGSPLHRTDHNATLIRCQRWSCESTVEAAMS